MGKGARAGPRLTQLSTVSPRGCVLPCWDPFYVGLLDLEKLDFSKLDCRSPVLTPSFRGCPRSCGTLEDGRKAGSWCRHDWPHPCILMGSYVLVLCPGCCDPGVCRPRSPLLAGRGLGAVPIRGHREVLWGRSLGVRVLEEGPHGLLCCSWGTGLAAALGHRGRG